MAAGPVLTAEGLVVPARVAYSSRASTSSWRAGELVAVLGPNGVGKFVAAGDPGRPAPAGGRPPARRTGAWPPRSRLPALARRSVRANVEVALGVVGRAPRRAPGPGAGRAGPPCAPTTSPAGARTRCRGERRGARTSPARSPSAPTRSSWTSRSPPRPAHARGAAARRPPPRCAIPSARRSSCSTTGRRRGRWPTGCSCSSTAASPPRARRGRCSSARRARRSPASSASRARSGSPPACAACGRPTSRSTPRARCAGRSRCASGGGRRALRGASGGRRGAAARAAPRARGG
jgi:hypothetical protein